MRLLSRSNLRIVLPIVCGLSLVCYISSTPAAQNRIQPPYFLLMEQGHKQEKNGNYEEAIHIYKQALRKTDGVDPDLRTKSKIAAHNRIAACYRSLGRWKETRSEFNISVSLGDTKYAPKALQNLK